ncbi:hypothetical protein GCM10010503_35540 [Streptomyces lucensis JCM 4490]|uniref:Uncharacterized protein n=1 Tax=Streptomyces lucensis JCM 4490 TaxID=1306176 RepID=A0A918J7H5_9ACTN|nr:hypothetical protein [Streptomyces lucensis]GGW55386.1 hypothetical protein GCM10010503_35540 [Streptomyces lucensis JCM 4490]
MAVLWSAAYTAFGLACALSGTALFGGSGRASIVFDWAGVTLGAFAAAVCGAVLRCGPRPLLRALLRVAGGLAAAAAFGLLMDVITLVFGEGVDSWAAAANHMLAAVGALLLTATAVSDRHPPGGTTAPAPSCAPVGVQLTACAGTVAFLPYAAMKLIWACGGTFADVSKEEMLAVSERNGASEIWLTLESWGLDATVLLAALGVFLLWGLVRPWGQVFPRWSPLIRGRRVPRWLPLVPALIGAATLAPYGVLGLGYCALATAGVVTMRQGDFHSPGDALLVSWPGMIAFAVYGVALAVAARSYWLRTRPMGQDGADATCPPRVLA